MQVNLNRPCPFWPDDGACALRDCSVDACKEVSIDYKYWKMAWRKAAETFQNVTIHGLVMRTCLIFNRNIANWYKLGYKPPEMEKVIFTLVTFRFFLSLLCNKHKIYCSLSFEQKFYIMIIRLSQFCAYCLFFMIVSSCREYAPTDTKHSIACLFFVLLRRKKKWISWSSYNAQWIV